VSLAIEANRTANGVVRDQYVAMDMAIRAKAQAAEAISAGRVALDLADIASRANHALYEAKARYAELVVADATSVKNAALAQAESLAQSAGQQRALLAVSAAINLLALVAIIVVVAKYRPMIIERIKSEQEPVVVENQPSSGVMILPPMNDQAVFDELLRSAA